MAGVTDSQRVDREQVESDYWFGRLRSRLLQEVLWADDQAAAIPYELVRPLCFLCGYPWVDGTACLFPNLTHGD